MTSSVQGKICAVINIALVIPFITVLCSCEIAYLSVPQPIDVKNDYKFPRQFRGKWMDDDQMITLGKNFIRIDVVDSKKKIFNGVYVNPGDTIAHPPGDSVAWRRFFDADKPFPSTKRIRFDSLRHPVDTVSNYIMKDGVIYEIEGGKLLSGVRFTMKEDTLYTKEPEPGFVQYNLGPNFFLRKISRSRYIVNINGMFFPNEEKAPWWIIGLLERSADGEIYWSMLNVGKIEESEKIYDNNGDYYFDSRWTQAQLVKLIDEGLFEDRETFGKKLK